MSLLLEEIEILGYLKLNLVSNRKNHWDLEFLIKVAQITTTQTVSF